MKTKEIDFEVQVPKADGTGVAEKVTVTVPVRWDEELQEWLMTPEAHEIMDNTKARLIGLLLPSQLKELRERYGYTQKEMGELFQAGEKSWTRWESGKHRPSRVINLLIRALYEGEISVNYLLKRAGKPLRREPQRQFASFLCQSSSTAGRKFTESLRSGALKHLVVYLSEKAELQSEDVSGRWVEMLQSSTAEQAGRRGTDMATLFGRSAQSLPRNRLESPTPSIA